MYGEPPSVQVARRQHVDLVRVKTEKRGARDIKEARDKTIGGISSNEERADR